MKNYLIFAMMLTLVACNNSEKNAEAAKKSVLDSVNAVNYAVEVKQRTIDSMSQVANAQHHSHVSSQSNQETVATTASGKKKMSNKTKGALIGTGAGVVAGAIIGGIINKDNPAVGAAAGGAIGGAVGSGVGYGAGAAKDKKAAQTKTTTTKP